MLRNGEFKLYKGKKITKINSKKFVVGGYLVTFDTYDSAKAAIDAVDAEDKALRAIDSYVQNELGGYL